MLHYTPNIFLVTSYQLSIQGSDFYASQLLGLQVNCLELTFFLQIKIAITILNSIKKVKVKKERMKAEGDAKEKKLETKEAKAR